VIANETECVCYAVLCMETATTDPLLRSRINKGGDVNDESGEFWQRGRVCVMLCSAWKQQQLTRCCAASSRSTEMSMTTALRNCNGDKVCGLCCVLQVNTALPCDAALSSRLLLHRWHHQALVAQAVTLR
jgi:hypothetical protein